MTQSSSKEIIQYNPQSWKVLYACLRRNLQRGSQRSPTVSASWPRMVDMLHLMIHSTPIITCPPGLEDDVENQGVVNRRNPRHPAEVEDQVDQNNGKAGRLLGDYVRPNYNGIQSSVRWPPIAANNLEIKHSVLQAILNNCVFRGKQNEDSLKIQKVTNWIWWNHEHFP